MIGLRNGLFDFQKDCVEYLLNTTLRVNSKLNIVVKAPTGAGKESKNSIYLVVSR